MTSPQEGSTIMVKSTTKKAAAPAATDGTQAPAADTKKRRILTPEEKIAKLQQDLADAQAKLRGKDEKRLAQLTEQRKALVEKRDDAQLKIDGIDGELQAIEARLEAAATEVSES